MISHLLTSKYRVTLWLLLFTLSSTQYGSRPKTGSRASMEQSPNIQDREVLALTISADGGLLAAGTSDEKITLWRIADRVKLWEIKPRCYPRSLAFQNCKDILAAAGYGWEVELLSVQDGKLKGQLEGGKIHPVNALHFSPDGSRLAVGSDRSTNKDGRVLGDTVTVWDVAGKKAALRIPGLKRPSTKLVSFLGDSSKLLVASGETYVDLLDADTGKELKRFECEVSLDFLSVSPKGRYVAGATDSEIVLAGKVEHGELVNEKDPSTVVIWDGVSSHRMAGPITRSSITGLGFFGDGKFLAYSDSINVYVFSMDRKKIAGKCTHELFITDMAASASGGTVVIADQLSKMYLVDIDQFKLIPLTK